VQLARMTTSPLAPVQSDRPRAGSAANDRSQPELDGLGRESGSKALLTRDEPELG